MTAPTFDEHYAAEQLARRANPLRAWVKQRYLNRILRHVRGVTVDIGCGAGQLLEQLPNGSIGLEVNAALIEDLRARGLNVFEATPDPRAISLGSVLPGAASTVVLSHVLEHFADAASVLGRLMADCSARGITRLIVPGLVGYRSDATHKTFVNLGYLRRHGLLAGDGFRVIHRSFFPGNLEALGRLFIYHELMVVYELADRSNAR
jgi:SAM-dependent methyltransferase